MRNLASIQVIKEITPIKGSDFIVCATVLGWNLIVKKDEFKVGDFCVYIEIDSLLPKDNVIFAFMEKHKYRVKTIKMRGVISQGLALPVTLFKELEGQLKVGMDVTDILKIEKYDKEEDQDPITKKKNWYSPLMKYRFFKKIIYKIISNKENKGFPSHIISKSDETRIQNMPWMFEKYSDSNFIVTEKIEGSSGSYTLEKKGFIFPSYSFTVASRNNKLGRGSSNWWKIAQKYNIEKVLETLIKKYPAKSWAIQGEVCGNGIQKNIYGIKGIDFYVYRLKKNNFNGTTTFFNPIEGEKLLKDFGMKWVPILNKIRLGDFNLESILKYADGKSVVSGSDTMREGFVFVKEDDPMVSFKAVSNEYLLKK